MRPGRLRKDSAFHHLRAHFEIARELLQFFWGRKWWWLTPVVTLLLLFSILVALAQTSGLAPMIYALF
jgi:hypothetical protein